MLMSWFTSLLLLEVLYMYVYGQHFILFKNMSTRWTVKILLILLSHASLR